MAEKPYLSLSVHQLVDFLLRQGDIDDRVFNSDTMQAGSAIHASFQSKQDDNYLSEYYLLETFVREKGTIKLDGRADGIILGGEYPIVDEIKSTVEPLEKFFAEQGEWHLGQAECYALMYLHQEKLEKIGIRLTYLSQRDEGKMVKEFTYTAQEIEAKVDGYLDQYLEFMQLQFDHEAARDQSVKALPFPFKSFRPGQRELAKYAYGIAKNGGYLFAEAPTGIGKTMSTLYPFVKAFKRGSNDRIFYLTAKSTGAEAAYQAVGELYRKGFVGHDSLLLAKDKICFSSGHSCNPDDCPFAKGYYTKLKSVILAATKSDKRFDDSFIIKTARKNAMCPFELQLDLSLYSDIIICDYNYFFDPLVHLQRYFDPQMADASHDLILVDEAHNLVERGRDMYSATLDSKTLFYAKRKLRRFKLTSLKRALGKVEKAFAALGADYPEGASDLSAPPEDFNKALESFMRAHKKLGKDGGSTHFGDDYKEFFLETNKYLKLLEQYFSTSSRVYMERKGPDVKLKLYCLDPSKYLKQSFALVKGAIIFSATLSPIDYYMDAILGSHDYPFLLLPSPFPKENFDLMLAPKVSVRYKDRGQSYPEVAEYLKRFVAGKVGNYFIYFPSYEYLENVRPYLTFEGADILVQDRDMKQEERGAFLSNFALDPKKTTVGLLVLGGAFSEGIDLVSDRLIGVALVGIGLPQIGHDNNLIRDYHEKLSGQGFEYAYMDPGMNKVMQAVGRLIRSETDRGAALLIDDRYLRDEYRDLFIRTWSDYDVVTAPEDVDQNLSLFYKKKSN